MTEYFAHNMDVGYHDLDGKPGFKMVLQVMHILDCPQSLKQTNGRIQGGNGAAQILGLNPGTLRSRMDKLGIVYKRKERNGGI